MSKFSILLPSKLKIVQEDETKGVYEIDGLYPGYGHTLGNSLRRIILSSLPGAAITAVKITGADHEFATIPGIKEDAVTILLNLKKARFRVDSDEVQTINVKIGGPKVVTAGDLQGDNALVTVTNPDQYICEVTDTKATLEMELTVQQGMGYVSRENLFKEKVSVGTMTLDATFSPIRKVSYEVEDMRVGERTDHNRLRISVQTDGSMSPKAVLEESIKTMLAQMQAILDLKDIEESIPRIQRPDIITTGAPEESADTEDPKGNHG